MTKVTTHHLSTLCLALTLTGCFSGNVENRVQPGAVAKTALEGEFFWRNTVSDVPYGTTATFAGAQSELERIRWTIEEDFLIGHRSYEKIANTQSPDDEESGSPQGAPLLMYRIEKQFDIRRNYNPSTGEEGNVIQENVDDPWYEREYLRIDWSRNHAQAGWVFAGVDLKVAEYAPSAADDEEAPRFDDSDGDGVFDHISLHTRVLAQPDTQFIPRYGDVPVCLFFGRAQFECGASEITIHSSFLRVDEEREYDALAFNDKWMRTFGFFSTERMHYDRQYGLTEPGRVRYANRHGLWEETWKRNEYGAILCSVGEEEAPCATFDAEDQPQPVAMRYQDRAVRPLVYHVSENFNDNYRDQLDRIASAWNEPFQDTVNQLRFWECIGEGGDAASCEEVKDDALQMFVLCPNNPSLPEDPALCSTDYTGPDHRPDGIPDAVEIGDLRFNQLALIENPHLSSPLGYGPSAADPMGSSIPLAEGKSFSTGAGEIINTNAFIYTHGLDRIAEQITDLVLLINGDISPEEFADGENVRQWVEALQNGDDRALSGETWGRQADAWDETSLRASLDNMKTPWSRAVRARIDSDHPNTPQEVAQWEEHVNDAMRDSGVFGGGVMAARENWETLADSSFSHNGWDTETLAMLGLDGDLSRPMDLIDPVLLDEEEAGLILAGEHAVDLDQGQYLNPNLLGLAQRFLDEGADRDTIYETIRDEMFVSVTLHEIGHTVGLRHNFASSFDAFNFHPEYWNLRDDGDMGPRHVDPETDAELAGGLQGYQYSSVMDYQSSDITDWHGLGKYDHAAVKFGYGHLVEVLNDLENRQAISGLPNDFAIDLLNFYSVNRSQPGPILTYNSGKMFTIHYTQYPKIANLESRVDVPLDRLVTYYDDPAKDGPLSYGLKVDQAVPDIIHKSARMVPYRFCTDRDTMGLSCTRWDQGADFYEIQESIRSRYFRDYVLRNLRRERYGFGNERHYLSRLYRSVFRPLREFHIYYTLWHGLYGVDEDTHAANFFAAEDGFGAWTAATTQGFDFLTQVILRPEPGYYVDSSDDEGNPMLSPTWKDEGIVEVGVGLGAWYDSKWDHASGYYWFEQQSRIGVHWDKMLALQTLTDASPRQLVGMETMADPREYALGYQDLYAEPLTLFLGRLTAGEVGQLAPVMSDDGRLHYPDTTQLNSTWPPSETQFEVLEPGAHWLLQYNAGLFGKALLQRGYDASFLRQSRLFLKGHGSEITPPDDIEEVSFTNPSTGETYVAWSYPGENNNVELGPAARLIQKGNRLKERCAESENPSSLACDNLKLFGQDIDAQYRMYQYFEGY